MRAFRNQTKRIHFDAHGREIRPGHIIGFETERPPADPAESDSDSAGDSTQGKTAPVPQADGKGGKGSSK